MVENSRGDGEIRRSRIADFDEQLWTVNCAILILAGFIAGVVIALSDFTDPRLLYNGWMRLATVGLLVGLLFAGVTLLKGKMRRRVQLGVLLSLLVHLWIAMFLHAQILQIPEPPQGTPGRQLADNAVAEREPDFRWTPPEEIIPDEDELVYDEPVDTPAATVSDAAAVRTPSASIGEAIRDFFSGSMGPLTPDAASPRQPDLPNLARAELSAPRRADSPGGRLTRQEWKHLPQPGEPIPEPNAPVSAGEAEGSLDAKVAAIGRQESAGALFERRAYAEPEAERHYPTVGLARQGSRPDPLPEKPTTPVPGRQILNPSEVVRSEALAPQPIGAGTTSQAVAAAGPAGTAAARQAGASVAVIGKPPQASGEQASQPSSAGDVRGPQRVASSSELAASTSLKAGGQQTPRAPSAIQTAAPAEIGAEGIAAATVASQGGDGQPASTSVSRGASAAISAAAQPQRGQAIAPMTAAVQLPAVPARRAAGERTAAGATDGPSSESSTLARSSRGIASPSTILPVLEDTSTTPAAMGGSLASGVEAVSTTTAVSRSSTHQAPSGANAAASGSAEFAVGASPIPARRGLPRASGLSEVSVAPNGPAPRIAKMPAAVTLAAAIGEGPTAGGGAAGPAAESVAGAGSAAGSGGSLAPSAGASLTSPQRGGAGELAGLMGMPAGELTGSASATQITGLAGPTAIRRDAMPTDVSVGSGSAISRAPSGTLAAVAAGARVDEPALGGTGANAASPNGSAGGPMGGGIEAASGSPSRQTPGLTGSRTSEPIAGAVASMTNLGRPLPTALARRALASESRNGGQDGAPSVSTTIVRNVGGGLVPAMAVPSEPLGLPGAGGVGVAQGGMTSKFEVGSYVSVERRAGGGSPGKTATPGGMAEVGVGAQETLILAGPVRSGGDGAPVVQTASPGSSLGRSPLGAMSGVSTVGSVEKTEPTIVDGPSGGSGDGLGGPGSAAVAAASTAVGRGTAASGTLAGAAAGGLGATGNPVGSDPLASAVGGPQTGIRRNVGAAIADTSTVAIGTGKLQRTAAGSPLSEVSVESVGMSGNSTGSSAVASEIAGGEGAAGWAGSATGASRQAAGLPGEENGLMHVEGAVVAGPTATTPGLLAGPRRLPQGLEGGVPIAAEVGGGPIGKANTLGLVRGLTETIEPLPVGETALAQAGTGHDPTVGSGLGQPQHQEGGLPVLISAPPGPGGLGGGVSRDLGIPSRLARTESDVVHTVARRFLIERSGGGIAMSGSAREATPPFEQRDPRLRRQAIEAHGGDGYTERAVEVGVDFFARIQFPDGHWSLNKLPPGVKGDDAALGSMDADTAATGLALLTYLGAGYTHLDDKHREIVRRGVDWLVHNQKPDGELFTGGAKYARFYSHGIAAIALCEAYGMTQDPELREPARKAIDFILKSQNPKLGGWRYDTDPKTGKATETDTSVTGWQLMALKSAQMAGLEVPPEAFRKVNGWLEIAEAENGKSIYNPFADKRRPEQLEGLKPNLAMTAEGMLMRLYVGHERGEAKIVAGADYLKANLPQVGTAKTPLRDCYYWYYATQAMFQMQGEHWNAWNEGMRAVLQSSQADKGVWAGSWHPNKPIRDRWGDAGGRVYVTAMHLLMLEVYYRHLPLYQELSK